MVVANGCSSSFPSKETVIPFTVCTNGARGVLETLLNSSVREERSARHSQTGTPMPATVATSMIVNFQSRENFMRFRLWRLCGLTFELSGRRRQDARPGLAKMYRVPPDRAWWPAVGAPLERGVRPHCLAASSSAMKSARIGVIRSCHCCAHQAVKRQSAAFDAATSLRPIDDS